MPSVLSLYGYKPYIAQALGSARPSKYVEWFNLMNAFKTFAGKGTDWMTIDNIFYMLEGTVAFIIRLARSTGIVDIILTCLDYLRTITRKSLLQNITDSKLFSKFMDEIVPMFTGFFSPAFDLEKFLMENTGMIDFKSRISKFKSQSVKVNPWIKFGINSLGDLVDRYDEVAESPFTKRLKRFVMYSLCAQSTENMNLKFSEALFSKLQRDQALFEYKTNPGSFVFSIIKDFTFFAKQGLAVMETGDISSFWLSSDRITSLHNDYAYLMANYSKFISGSCVDFDSHEYMKRLDITVEAIKRTLACLKLSPIKSMDLSYLRRMHMDLLTKQSDIYTEQFARQSRDPPFGICIEGKPGVGKSSLIDIFGSYFAKIKGKSYSSDIKYTKNPTANFWDGYRSSQWMIVLDDVGFLHPKRAPNGDPTLMEILQIHNTTAFVPDQASLELKGRTPCRCELLVATTNSKDLNAERYFQTPSAVLRRFDICINVSVKPEFATKDGRLDHKKIQEMNSFYERQGKQPIVDTYWNLEVYRYKLCSMNRFTRDPIFNGPIEEFFRFENGFREIVESHLDALRIRKSNEKLRENTSICEVRLPDGRPCGLLTTMCEHNVISAYGDSPPPELDPEPSFARLQEIIAEHYKKFTKFSNDFINKEFSHLKYYNVVMAGQQPKKSNVSKFKSQSDDFDDGFETDEEEYIEFQASEIYFNSSKVDSISDDDIKKEERKFKKLYKEIENLKTQLWHSENCARLAPKLWAKHIALLKRRIHQKENFLLDSPYAEIAFKKNVAKARKKNIMITATVVSALVLVIGCVSAASFMMPKKAQAIQPIKTDSQVNVWQKKPDAVPYPAYTDTNTIHDKLSRNIGVVTIFSDDDLDEHITTGALCIKGVYWITTLHAFDKAKHISLKTQNSKSGVTINTPIMSFDPKDHILIPGRDLIILRMVQSNPCKDISYMFPKDDVCSIRSDGHIYYKSDECVSRLIICNDIEKCGKPVTYSTGGWFSKSFQVSENDIKYTSKNFDGLCGFPVISVVSSISRTGKRNEKMLIAGIHTAGYGNESLGRLISQSWLDSVLPQPREFQVQVSPHECEPIGYPLKSVQLDPVHEKSPLCFLPSGLVEVHGSLKFPRVTRRSVVAPTIMAKSVQKHCGVPLEHGPPDMKSWRPFFHAAKDLVNPVTKLDASLISECALSYLSDICANISNPSDVELYDIHTVINGANGIRFVDKLNFNTSAGFPFKGSKQNYLEPSLDERKIDSQKFNEEVMAYVSAYEDNMRAGRRSGAVFTAHLKDEPRALAKVESGKTRVFTGCNVAFTMLQRKYFLSITRLLQNNWRAYNGAVGVNCFSDDWGEFYDFLTCFGTERIVAGDYKAFDKRMPPVVILHAFEILIHLNIRLGNFSDEDIMVMRGIATDVAYPRTNFNGDFVEFVGGNPSGHALTVVINSLANAIYMRYCFSILCTRNKCAERAQDFNQYVSLLTYGDDNIMGVSTQCDFFNHTSISGVLAEVDITYTMAEKDQASVPFINISQASFLKRTWRKLSGIWVCPLDKTSIFRSLMLRLYDSPIGDNAHATEVLGNACREFSLYGVIAYNEHIEQLKKVVTECDIRFSFPTWREAFSKVYHLDVGDVATGPGSGVWRRTPMSLFKAKEVDN